MLWAIMQQQSEGLPTAPTSSPYIIHIIISNVPIKIIILENLEHHIAIYKRFAICLNSLNVTL